MQYEIIIAGMGGQGVMLVGQLLAQAALLEDKNVVWYPAYGPETRGGTAECTIIISEDEIGSPIAPTPDVLIAINQVMLDRDAPKVKPGGTIIYNASLSNAPDRTDCKIFGINANDIADKAGIGKAANMVMLGAFVELVGSVKMKSVKASLTEVLPERYYSSIPLNETVLDLGSEEIKKTYIIIGGISMARPMSKLSPDWWDFTTLDQSILNDAAKLTHQDMIELSRPGFKVVFYDTLEDFYLAEALEYIDAWKQSTPDNPVGICGPVGPTEQLPLVARLVNSVGLNLKEKAAHFWGMDEWVIDGKAVVEDHLLSFVKADKELCFNRIKKELQMANENMHFPKEDPSDYINSYNGVRCAVMQGGQGEIKHWAFNDPVRREGAYKDNPPTPEEYLKLSTRMVNLHPATIMQNARTSGGGRIDMVPSVAMTVGPTETWKAEKVSIWHAGTHDNPFGMRLTSLMISKNLPDSSCPMSLLALHPNVQFNFFRRAVSSCDVEMH